MKKLILFLVCAAAGLAQQAPVTDTFSAASLNTALWTVHTPSGGSITQSSDHAFLAVPGGSNHDPSVTGSDQSVYMTQNVGNADFDIAAKFDVTPSATFSMTGIKVQQDASNFERFEISTNGTVSASCISVTGGNATNQFQAVVTPSTSNWLRVIRTGNLFTLKFSTDGATYSTIGSFSITITVNQVGVYAGNYNSTPSSSPAYTSQVDSFTNLSGTQAFNGGIITNGDFSASTNNWSFFTNGTGTFTQVAGNPTGGSGFHGQIAFTTMVAGPNVQLFQVQDPVAPQTSYTLTFYALASTARTITASLKQGVSPFANYGMVNQPFSVTTGWQAFSFTFTSLNTSAVVDAQFTFGLNNFQTGDSLSIANISIVAQSSGGGGGTGVVAIGPNGLTNVQPGNSVNVKTNCGAVGNGSTNDASAIQTCINNSSPGQTIYFPNGTYVVGSIVRFSANRTYLGQSVLAQLHTSNSGGYVADTVYDDPLNIVLNTLTFDNGALGLNGGPNGSNNIHITNCTFQNNTQGSIGGGTGSSSFIWASGGLTHSQIDHNKFFNLLLNGATSINGNKDYDGDTPRSAIFAQGYDNTSVDHNLVDTVYQGFKGCMLQFYEEHNIYFGYNIFKNVHRIPIEIQDGVGCGHNDPSKGPYDDYFEPTADTVTIEYNSVSFLDEYFGSFGFSWADHFNVNMNFHHNMVMGGPLYNANGTPSNTPGIGVEIGMRQGHAHDSLVVGPFGGSLLVFSGSQGDEVNNIVACNVDTGGSPPTVGDENNPAPTDTNYHNNDTYFPCQSGTNNVGTPPAYSSIALNSVSLVGTTLSGTANVTTADPGIAVIKFTVDGNLVSSTAIPSYTLTRTTPLSGSLSYNVSSLPTGQHTLAAVATDVWGNNWNSNTSSFTTTSATTTPCCTLGGKATISGKAAMRPGP